MEKILEECPNLAHDDLLASVTYITERSRGRFVDLLGQGAAGSRTAGLIAESAYDAASVAQEKLRGTNEGVTLRSASLGVPLWL